MMDKGEGPLAQAPCSQGLGTEVPPSAQPPGDSSDGMVCEKQQAQQLSGRKRRGWSSEEGLPQPDAEAGSPGGQPSSASAKVPGSAEGVATPHYQDAGMAAAVGGLGQEEDVTGGGEEEDVAGGGEEEAGADAGQTEVERVRAERIGRNTEVMPDIGLDGPTKEHRLSPNNPAPLSAKAQTAQREYPLRSRKRAAAETATPPASADSPSTKKAAVKPTTAAKPGKKRQCLSLPGSIGLTVSKSNLEGGYLNFGIEEEQLEYLGLRTAAEGGQPVLMVAPGGRCWVVEVRLSEQYGAGKQYALQRGFGKLLGDLRVVEGDVVRLWPLQQGRPGRHVVLDFELQRGRRKEESPLQGASGTEWQAGGCPDVSHSQPLPAAPPAGTAQQQAQQQGEERGPAQQLPVSTQGASPATPPVVAAAQGEGVGEGWGTGADVEPSPQLLRLQRALWAAQLPPSCLADFEEAWQGMAPQQRRCIYNAMCRAAGPAGSKPSPGEAAVLRELAVRALASLPRGRNAASTSAAAGHDLHATLCELQGMLDGGEGLEPNLLTQFELAWLGQHSPSWYSCVGGMVRRAHAQGAASLAEVVTAVVHSR